LHHSSTIGSTLQTRGIFLFDPAELTVEDLRLQLGTSFLFHAHQLHKASLEHWNMGKYMDLFPFKKNGMKTWDEEMVRMY
jgi:hypothetical protein